MALAAVLRGAGSIHGRREQGALPVPRAEVALVKRSAPLKRKAPMKRSRGPKRRWKAMTPAEKAAKADFWNAVAIRCGFACVRSYDRDHECVGELDAHHIIPKQLLKGHALTLTAEERIAIVWDSRNGVLVCREGLHGNLTNKADRLREREVPACAVAFAEDNGLMWALEREVPEVKPWKEEKHA
jgi:hypothetical protein